MAKIKIISPANHPPSTTFQKIKEHLPSDKLLNKYAQNLKFTFDDQNHTGTLTGSGFDAQIKVTEAQAEILVDLSFLLTPFKSQIEDYLKKKLTSLVS